MAPRQYHQPSNGQQPTPAYSGLLLSTPPTDWVAVLTPLFAEIDKRSRHAAREEYAKMLAEQVAEAEEADRNDQVLTVAEAAALLGIRPQSAYMWIKDGKLQAFRIGRTVRLKRGQVLAALQAQTQADGRRKYARRATTKSPR